MLNVEALSVRYGPLTILKEVSFSVEPGRWLMVIGPNGAGKSTLLGALAQSIPYTGTVKLEGDDLKRMRSKMRARRLGMLSQQNAPGYAFSVEEVARLGRYGYGNLLSGDADNEKAVEDALLRVGMLEKRKQPVDTLSGGELQRTFLAQLFAQDPRVMLLDEPTNHLDIAYQQQVFAWIEEWRKREGKTVISVVHDLSLARAYGTHALLLHRGNAVAYGEIRGVMSRENLQRAYETDVIAWMKQLYGQWEEAGWT